jgi:hypothetical protein
MVKIGGKLVHYKEWQKKGLNYLQDILDENGNLLSINQIEYKSHMQCKVMQYNSLLAAIPIEWKRMHNSYHARFTGLRLPHKY